MTPKVSIIVPVYNTEKYLRPCLDSIQAQTFTDFEAILVDDGSTDSSGIICDEYAAQDSRFVVVHKKNEGVAKARDYGFNKSIGEYVTFVDSDDYISLNYVEKLLSPICKYQVDLVCCKHNSDSGGIISPSKYTEFGYYDKTKLRSFISSSYLYNNKLGHSGIPVFLVTKLIKREYVRKGLLSGKGLWWGEDQIASFQIIMDINSMYVLDDYIYYYVKHKGQATSIYNSSLWKNQLQTFLRYKSIDVDGILGKQLIKHVWKYSFLVNIYKKMPTKIHSVNDFSKELKEISKNEGWRDFFCGITTGLGWRNDIKYWLLKLKLYRLFYILFLKKQYESKNI